MGNYKEIQGNLIELAQKQKFDVIAHGCNCFCVMGAGLAPQMARAFNVDKLRLEDDFYKGDINKLGNIDYGAYIFEGELKKGLENNIAPKTMLDALGRYTEFPKDHKHVIVVNAYTQYDFGGNKPPVDYAAVELCMKKINKRFKGKTIGLPKIGAGLAGGNWETIKKIIQTYLKDCNVIVVNYKP